MSVAFLDCRNEVSAMRSTVGDKRAWLTHEIQPADWIVPVDRPMEDELGQLSNFIEQNPLQDLQRKVTDFSLPACANAMAGMKSILDNGVGFAVLDRLNIEQIEIAPAIEIYWLLGQLIGRPVAQKWNGQMIYDVHDSGKAFGYGVRGSTTATELVFHVDNAFAKMVPDYVGLFCRNSAQQGGTSRFCSLYTVHQRMQELYPALLERLYQPMYFDRQAEHQPGKEKVCLAPYFSWHRERLNARANSSLVRKGYEVAGEKIDDQLKAALDAIDEVCSSEDIWFEGALERGQIQYLNNHEVGHYRSEFVDHDEPDKKRHLYRLWHRQRGTACYDGESLSI